MSELLKMGVLINGVWTEGELPQEYADGGRFKRAESRFRDRITDSLNNPSQVPILFASRAGANPKHVRLRSRFATAGTLKLIPFGGRALMQSLVSCWPE